jgi:hypothetical protein
MSVKEFVYLIENMLIYINFKFNFLAKYHPVFLELSKNTNVLIKTFHNTAAHVVNMMQHGR